MILKYLNLNLLVLMFAFTCEVNADVVRRAAFDFGSGKMKLQVADVDVETKTIQKSIYAEDMVVLLSEDACNHPQGCFSEAIQQKALFSASSLKQKAIELGAVEFAGIATEAYRKASNGYLLIERYMIELGIPVKIVTQKEEGEFGFNALIAEAKLDPDKVISWDIGGGSFQITYLDQDKNCQVYMAPYGRITTKNTVTKYIKGEDPAKVISPNPISRAEWENSLSYFKINLPEIPPSLAAKLSREDVNLVGISAHPEELRKLEIYHLKDIERIVVNFLDKNDLELASIHKTPPSAVTELVLVYSIMDKLNVSTVNYIRTSSGSSSALLIMEEYWK